MTSASAFTPNGAAATNVASLSITSRRINLSDPPINGWEKIRSRLEELSRLEVGWDGYKGVPMRFEVGYFAAEIIKNVCDQSVAYAPQIIPGCDGDVQIEWHCNGSSIELHVKAPYDVTAWRTNPTAGENGEQVSLSTDFTIVSQWLREFSGSIHANATSAA